MSKALKIFSVGFLVGLIGLVLFPYPAKEYFLYLLIISGLVVNAIALIKIPKKP